MKPDRKAADPVRASVTRRAFLKKGGMLAGLAAAGPALLPGCKLPNPADDQSGRTRPREKRTLHFDFSLGGVSNLRLFALGSQSHGALLRAHTASSLQQFRAQDPTLTAIPDAQLTHYLENVDLPANALQHVMILGDHADTGAPVWAASFIHVPAASLQQEARRAVARGRMPALTAKMRAYGIRPALPTAQVFADLVLSVANYVTPEDTATTLVFQHAQIMNLDTQQGASILADIATLPCTPNEANCTPFLEDLVDEIKREWPATTTGGWAKLIPETYLDGTPLLDQNGKPIYRYDVSTSTLARVATVVQIVSAAIYDDLSYEGNNWHALQGITAIDNSAGAIQTAQRRDRAQSGTWSVLPSTPIGASMHGVEFMSLSITDPVNRVFQLEIKNRYLRFLSAYVQFLDAAGNPLPPPTPAGEYDTSRAQYLAWVITNDQVMGIPLTGDLVHSTFLNVTVPANASQAKVMFGSLGVGGDAFCPEALAGSVLTLAFNIGIPTLFLLAGVGSEASAPLTKILTSGDLLNAIVKAAEKGLEDAAPDLVEGIYSTGSSSDAGPFLTGAANVVAQSILGSVPALAGYLAGILTAEELTQAVPIIGTVVKIISVAADVAALSETVFEVLLNPALFDNTVSLSMSSTVTISHDPTDSRFPATAAKYIVMATYDQTVLHVSSGTITQPRTAPIVVTFDPVPAGGNVQVDVAILTADNWLVGYGSTGPLQNTPPTAGQIAIAITELLIPLSASTQYQHSVKLEYSGGKRNWVQTATPPTATQASLCTGQSNQLCQLNGVTISQLTGMVGYAYKAGGLTECGTSVTDILNTIQGVSYAQPIADNALKTASCGWTAPAGVVYDLLGAASGRHFFLQPAADGYFYVRSVVLDGTQTPFNLNQPSTWGRFSQALDSLVVHPQGFVIGVSRQHHKMQILKLPDAPVSDAQAPTAARFAVIKCGFGHRPGLLGSPVAVALCTGTGNVLVLEQANRRVQAFDVSANPTNGFLAKSVSILPLLDEGPSVSYLDLGVESIGYIYVLSCINNGVAPSDYRLDIYDPNSTSGTYLARTTGVAAARLAVDNFRNMYALNYEVLAGAPRVEPSLSQWVPSTPS